MRVGMSDTERERVRMTEAEAEAEAERHLRVLAALVKLHREAKRNGADDAPQAL